MLPQVVDAVIILEHAVRRMLVQAEARLRDINRDGTVFFVQAQQHFVEAARENVPIPVRRRHVLARQAAADARNLVGARAALARTVVRDAARAVRRLRAEMARVVVDAEEIERRRRAAEHLELLVIRRERFAFGQNLIEQRARAQAHPPREHDVEQHPIRQHIVAPRGLEVGFRLAQGIDALGAMRDADAAAEVQALVQQHGLGMRDEHLVERPHGTAEREALPRREQPRDVALRDFRHRVFHREEMAHAVAEMLEHDARITEIRLRRTRREPALAGVGIGQVEMVERDEGLDAMCEAAVDHAVVEREAVRIHRAIGAQDAAPRKRQRQRPQAMRGRGRDVFLKVVVEIACGSAIVTTPGPREPGIPDRRFPAVRPGSALHLIRRERRPKQEILRHLSDHLLSLLLALIIRGGRGRLFSCFEKVFKDTCKNPHRRNRLCVDGDDVQLFYSHVAISAMIIPMVQLFVPPDGAATVFIGVRMVHIPDAECIRVTRF